MKNILFVAFLVFMPICVAAQDSTAVISAADVTLRPAQAVVAISQRSATDLRFGFLSYNEALQSMPEYTTTLKSLSSVKEKYEQETKLAEEEFNKKYEDFLEGLSDFPLIIRQKRQVELQELMTRNIAFRQEATRLYNQAENEAFGVLRLKLNEVLRQIGVEKGFAFILNTDNNACPYINIYLGEDINELVKGRLQ